MIKRSASRSFATFLRAANASPTLGGPAEAAGKAKPSPQRDHHTPILRALADKPLGFAAIRARTGAPLVELMEALVALESFGLVQSDKGEYSITEEGRRTLAAAP